MNSQSILPVSCTSLPHVDDLVQPRAEQITRSCRLVLLRPHRSLRCGDRIMLLDSRESRKRICKLPRPQTRKPCNLKSTKPPKNNSRSASYKFFTGDYLPQRISKISRRGRQRYGPSYRRLGRWRIRPKEISALFDRKIVQRRPAFEVLDENLANAAGAGNRSDRGDYKSHE